MAGVGLGALSNSGRGDPAPAALCGRQQNRHSREGGNPAHLPCAPHHAGSRFVVTMSAATEQKTWRGTLCRAHAATKNGTDGRDRARPSRAVHAAIPTPPLLPSFPRRRESSALSVRAASWRVTLRRDHVGSRVHPKWPHRPRRTHASYGTAFWSVALRGARLADAPPYPTPSAFKSLLTCSIDTHGTV